MKKIVLGLIRSYQRLNPVVYQGACGLIPGICKFHPSCSEYAVIAIDKHGLFRGGLKGIIRIIKCNPLTKGGLDLP